MSLKILPVGFYEHRILGRVEVTDKCIELQKNNLDSTSAFVKYKDEEIEVTLALIEGYENNKENKLRKKKNKRRK